MGNEIGAVYSALWQEVAWIHKKWGQYLELFGTNSERVALLNRAAPSMFRTMQDTLFEDVLLRLARLADPPKSMSKSNLSLRRLAALLASTTIGRTVEGLAQTALDASEFARDWRNRRLAHRDLDIALGQDAQPLAPASRAAAKSALAALESFLNAVSNHYIESTTMFDFGPAGADAASLVYLLRNGLHHREEQLARIKRGDIRPEDTKPEPL